MCHTTSNTKSCFYFVFFFISATNCSDENQFLFGLWCLTFMETPKKWQVADVFCQTEIGIDAILAPIYDDAQLVELVSLITDTFLHSFNTSRWAYRLCLYVIFAHINFIGTYEHKFRIRITFCTIHSQISIVNCIYLLCRLILLIKYI